MAPLATAASLLPLGRQLPAHENGDRDDHQAAEGHVRHDIGVHSGHPNLDRQLPGIPPELAQMFGKLMAPLATAASLLPLGRKLPSHENGDRYDHQAAEGHVRHDIGEVADATRNEEETRFGEQGKERINFI